jgi:hypothetical protein
MYIQSDPPPPGLLHQPVKLWTLTNDSDLTVPVCIPTIDRGYKLAAHKTDFGAAIFMMAIKFCCECAPDGTAVFMAIFLKSNWFI